jgi:large subunit ribosomal protein L25
MSTMALKATPREQTGKGVARRLRREGFVPGVISGVGDPTPLAVPYKAVHTLMTREGGDHGLIELTLDGKKRGVIIRDYQTHPVTGRLLHCDFQEVQKGHRLTVTVGIELVGETPPGVREQGILQHQMHELELDCMPDRIPEVIQVDASHLKIGDSIHVADLNLPEGVRAHAAEDATVVSVLPPKLAAEAEEAPEGEAPEAEAAETPAPE